MSYERGFSWTEWGHERRQSEHLDYLQLQLEFQRRSGQRTQQALKQQLARLSGDLSGRIDAIGRALDTFVELSDLRFELQIHQPAAMLRAAVRHFLVAAADSSEVPTTPLPDVADYWLRPATSALRALLEGRDARTELEDARGLDRRRTALFLTTALSVIGRPGDAAAHLDAAFATGGGTLSRAQVTLWQSSVHGHFGDAGREVAHAWMNDRVSATSPEGPFWDDVVARELPSRAPSGAPAAVHAAGRLTRLAEHCAEALAAEPVAEGIKLFGVLEGLVDEGSPPEALPLRRSAELRRQIEERTAEARPQEHFDDPAGTVDAVLAEGVTGDDPAVRASAVALAAPRLLEVADRLRETATGPFTENVRTVKRVGAVVDVGVFDEFVDLSAARATIEARHPRPNPVPWAMAALASALLALALAFLVPGLAILFGVAAAALAGRWVAVRRAAVEADSTVTWLMEALDKDVESARTTLVERREQAASAATDANRAHAELSKLLGGPE